MASEFESLRGPLGADASVDIAEREGVLVVAIRGPHGLAELVLDRVQVRQLAELLLESLA